MTGTTLERVNKARDSKERILVFSLIISLIAHGLFFRREWIILGIILFTYAVWASSRLSSEILLSGTDVLFGTMVSLSLLGMLHPVKLSEAWFEALRWVIFWLIFRWSREVSNPIVRERLFRWVKWIALVLAGVGWIPRLLWPSSDIPETGRLSSMFGYPNALAAFLAAVLLLRPRGAVVRAFLILSLLGTGSRAAVSLFLLISAGTFLRRKTKGIMCTESKGLFSPLRYRNLFRKMARTKYQNRVRNMFQPSNVQTILQVLLIFVAIGAALIFLTPALEHLLTWGGSSWGERLLYVRDGLILAWQARGVPQAGGWLAFPTVQQVPYWSTDPHSALLRIILTQGLLGVLALALWSRRILCKVYELARSEGESEPAISAMFSAMLFLILHSLVDADFSFGALGILFWMLAGLSSPVLYGQMKEKNPFRTIQFRVSGRYRIIYHALSFLFSLLLLAGCSSLILLPHLLEKGEVWSLQARKISQENPQKSIELWRKSLNWDQTKVLWRRELATTEFKYGDWRRGLQEVEKVLQWEPFNLRAYEWAQALVLEAAEGKRELDPGEARELYSWVEGIPRRIEERAKISWFYKKIWPDYAAFQPSQHMKLMAELARERQLASH